MQDARATLIKFLDADDLEILGQAVCTGFTSCHELMRNTPSLGNFQTGIPQWSHLVRSFVEHAISLAKIEKMRYEFRPNAAKNCWHTRFHKNGAAWTAHFVGGGINTRSMARRAICRAELAARSLPLFPDEAKLPDADDSHAYFQILHAGYKRTPESIVVVVPSRDQQAILAATPLKILQPSIAAVEQVKEEMHIELIKLNSGNTEHENSAG